MVEQILTYAWTLGQLKLGEHQEECRALLWTTSELFQNWQIALYWFELKLTMQIFIQK